jgi:hypothetical protein
VEIVPEEVAMQKHGAEDSLADLSHGIVLQEEFIQHRLAIEWTRTVIDRLLAKWMQLEAHEGMAYEDKLTSQVNMLDDATASLWHLHKTLGRFSRLLKDHQQHLRQLSEPWG